MCITCEHLTEEEKEMLVGLLLDNQYALELLSSEINDIENGNKKVNQRQYQKLLTLYDRIRFEMN
ncbi:antirepressor AbbA [Metabacillus arenae]|uniref:Antirepressor AbbA n=1 Tax=Metabacillus arenae TaxID=2771434 RepID=A0A926NIR2_9BACI|nr:antirepressor AbbA [Metabacillus arenae]MBD1381283.1 antirepressor AbbA [Metabacillus arenae]